MVESPSNLRMKEILLVLVVSLAAVLGWIGLAPSLNGPVPSAGSEADLPVVSGV